MQHAHPIDTYIEARKVREPGFNKGKFADLVGSDRSTIHRLMTGHDSVSTSIMESIEKATEGELTAVALFAEWQAAKKRRLAATENSPARAS